MKTMLKYMAMGLAASLAFGAGSARASLEVSARFTIRAKADFYAPLSANGKWIEVGAYGRCWHPVGVAVGWRPYCYGQWVWTDCGWYWESDEPWAWACYHYGSWVYDPAFGWIWVPGIEWAPSWVCWRVGGGYIGWAPLPPRGVKVALAGPEFVFVHNVRFQERVRPATVIVNNTTIIKETTVINQMKRETRSLGGPAPQEVMVNEGPRPDTIQKATGKQLKAVPIREASLRTPVPAEAAPGVRETKGRENPAPAPADTLKSAPGPRQSPAESKPAPARPDTVNPAQPPSKFDPIPGEPSKDNPDVQPREGPPGKPGPHGVPGKGHGYGKGQNHGKGKGNDHD